MKKFVAMGALALVLAACSLEQAKAWVNAKFGVGLNWSYQSGGNNLAWGVFRNGQPPACCDGPGCFGPGYGYPGYAQGFQGQGYPYAGTAPMGPIGPMPTPAAPAAGPSLPPPAPSSYLGNPNFQTVNYPSYYQPSYYYYPVGYSR